MFRKVCLVLAAVALPASAFAHAELLWPTARAGSGSECDGGGGDNCKVGPCGAGLGTPGGNIITLTQGSSITIQWQETIEHPGRYEIRLSTNGGMVTGQQLFTWALDANRPDNADVANGTIRNPAFQYTYTMTVPTSGNCNPCVLQFLQFMTNNNLYYYGCSDVRILAAGAPTPEPTPTITPEPTPEPNPLDGEMETVHGGCVCSTTSSASPGQWLLLAGFGLVALLAVRRALR